MTLHYRVASLAVMTIASLALAAPQKPAAPAVDAETIRSEVESLAKKDPTAAVGRCRKLLTAGETSQRPLAVALLLDFADAKALASVARELRSDQYHDERRLLVRGLGRSKVEDALPLLEAFTKDSDPLVRAAAVSALADHGRPIAVGLFVGRLPSMMDYWDISGTGDDYIFAVSAYGAFKHLAGEPPASGTTVKAWWEKNKASLTPKSQRPSIDRQADAAAPVAGRLLSGTFDLRFQPRGLDQTVATKFELKDAKSWAGFVDDLESMNARTREKVAPLFGGTLHMPVTRIDFTNNQTFIGAGGINGRAGVAMRSKIAFNIDLLRNYERWLAVVRHEYVHIIQFAQFATMPRWLAEGMACSYTESPDKTIWSPQRITSSQLLPLMNKGGATSAIAWQTDGVSGESEGPRYDMSHLFVDYLRFGPFSEPETRLFCLAGELNRGRPAAEALQRVYGKSVAEFDRGLTEWAQTLGKPSR